MIQSNKKISFSIVVLLITIILGGCTSKDKRKFIKIENSIEQKVEDVVFGNDTVTNTVFLYASYNCKFCRYLFKRTFPKLKVNYLDKGLVKVVVKWVEFSENQQSLYALKAASCIYRYGSYDIFHELLLTNPSVIISDDFRALIDDIMADNHEIAKCMFEDDNYEFLKENIKEFRANNLSGTPCLIINNHAYGGFISYENLKQVIKKEFNL